MLLKDFPGGPVFRTPHFHCRWHGFNPCLGNKDLAAMKLLKKIADAVEMMDHSLMREVKKEKVY